MECRLLSILVYLNVILLSFGYEVTLKDNTSGYGWKFSKGRPFHYFGSVGEVTDGFLPVSVDLLPNGDGVWVLRYKDMSHLPRQFAPSEGNPSKSFVKYSAKAQLFSKITLKALNVGDVDLEVTLGSEKISLSAIPQCSKVSEPTSPTNGYRWTIYEIHTSSPSPQVAIEVSISHPNSFFMLDEVSVTYSEPEDKKSSDERNEEIVIASKNGNFRVLCKSMD
ncbi:unnamed protein product [Orchesella dallaii]|uniref:Uncharacterized protein n=1 Tax=Orchesella dallaii TaxID=48710 RepID=A0ABP1QCF9_9HEXA